MNNYNKPLKEDTNERGAPIVPGFKAYLVQTNLKFNNDILAQKIKAILQDATAESHKPSPPE